MAGWVMAAPRRENIKESARARPAVCPTPFGLSLDLYDTMFTTCNGSGLYLTVVTETPSTGLPEILACSLECDGPSAAGAGGRRLSFCAARLRGVVASLCRCTATVSRGAGGGVASMSGDLCWT